MTKLPFTLVLIYFLIACKPSRSDTAVSEEYKIEMESWHQKRVDRLLSPIGWINVRGLFWLKEGINSFGSGNENDIIFPKGKIEDKAGFFILQDSIVTMKAFPDVRVLSNGLPVSLEVIYKDDTSKVKILEAGSLQWFVIKRKDKFGVRLRDLDSEQLKEFKPIEYFESDINWRLQAKLSVPPGKKIEVLNVLGQNYPTPVKGILSFTMFGKEYSLDAIDEDGKLFIIFGDLSSGKTTYGSGRYLYIDMPIDSDVVTLDFNMAINPPCAFTEFATCLLPPKQNILPFEVTAGEKVYH